MDRTSSCQFKKDEQRRHSVPAGSAALRYDALSQQCIQELNNCCQLLSKRSICIEIGSRFADGPVLMLLCISHAHE